MSFETWKKEFYPEAAQEAARVSELHAIERRAKEFVEKAGRK